jgi:hypothetical protein
MVFISYRRDPDRALAQLIETQLRARGIETWLDVTFDGAQRWTEMILKALTKATDVIVILSNELVQSESEHVRSEVEFALRLGKSIVPVTTPSFRWPAEDVSPPWLNEVRQYHAVAASWDYPEAFADRLVNFCFGAAKKPTD